MTKRIHYVYIFIGYKEMVEDKFIPAGLNVSQEYMLKVHPKSKAGKIIKKIIKNRKKVKRGK